MQIRDSLLSRKLHGPMADWDLHALLLRLIDSRLAGANWQRSGGKGQKPKPIELPDAKGRGSKPSSAVKAPGGDLQTRMRALGMIPPGATD